MPRRNGGGPGRELSESDLVRGLRHLYETRADTFFGGSRSALERHSTRMAELEGEYATRHAEEMEPALARTRSGARARAGQPVSENVSAREKRRQPSVE